VSSQPLTVAARVIEQLPNSLYRLELQTEQRAQITAHVGPEASLLRVRPGDGVMVELSAYDPGRGRIVGKSS
jgi:translation initiation factor IF-1